MALPSTFKLSPHFTAGELGADNPAIPMAELNNLRYVVAPALEKIRAVLGVPLVKVNGYRTPTQNKLIGGSSTSDHVSGLAADFTPQGLSMYDAYKKLMAARAARAIPDFDQLIFYPLDGHLHVGFGSRMRDEVRIKAGENFPLLTGEFVQRLTGYAAEVASAVSGAVDDATGAVGDVVDAVADGATAAVQRISKESGIAPLPILLILAILLALLVWRVTV